MPLSSEQRLANLAKAQDCSRLAKLERDASPTKRCTRCGEVKLKSEFYFQRARRRYRSTCKLCCRRAELLVPVDTKLAYRAQEKSNPRRRYNVLVNNASKRALPLEISFEEYVEFVKDKRCLYCEAEVRFGAGLDRKNSSLGYTLDNVVVCCGFCNSVKGDHFTAAQMMQIGALVRGWRGDETLSIPPRFVHGKSIRTRRNQSLASQSIS